MSILKPFFLLLILLLSASIALATQASDGLIVPGKRISGLVLGVPCSTVKKYEFRIEKLHCSKSGLVNGINTPTGGSIWIPMPDNKKMMNGATTAEWIIRTFGNEFLSHFDEEYPGAVAYWLIYKEKGIAFRVVYLRSGFVSGKVDLHSGSSGLQSIMVFNVDIK